MENSQLNPASFQQNPISPQPNQFPSQPNSMPSQPNSLPPQQNPMPSQPAPLPPQQNPLPPQPTPSNQSPMPTNQVANPLPKKKFDWIRLLRVIIWGLVAIFLPVGLSLKKISTLSSAFADGSYAIKNSWGNWIFWIALIVGICNAVLGIIRWILRWRKEKWTTGRVIGKLIGGGIWRTSVFTPIVIISFLFITPLIAHSITNHESPIISNDDYATILNNKIEDIANNPNAYNTTEIKKYYDIITLANVDFDTDASTNTTTTSSIFSHNAYALKDGVTILNKAKLTSNAHFVIFYTDTGDNKISDETANSLADMLEGFVDGFEQQFGQPWEYQQHKVTDILNQRSSNMNKVLEHNHLSADILTTAMPVYIYNVEDDSLAYYSNRKNAEFVKSIGRLLGSGDEISSTTISFPYILIKPQHISDISNLESISAHELAHHYADNYCYNQSGDRCKGGNFIYETFAQYWSVSVAKHQTSTSFLAKHHDNYVKYGVCYSIDIILPETDGRCHANWQGSNLGYAQFAFLYNYAHIESESYVKDRNNTIMEALNSETPLQVLYGSSHSTKFRYGAALVDTAQKNLTRSYGDKYSLKISNIPKGMDIPCSDMCTQKYEIDHSSSNYFYFSTSEYQNRNITVNHSDDILVSILASKNAGQDWTLLDQTPYNTAGITNLSKEDRAKLTKISYDIKKDSEYDIIAIVVTDTSISGGKSSYNLQITTDELASLLEEPEEPEEESEDSEEKPNDNSNELNNGCTNINTSELLDQFNSWQKSLSSALSSIVNAFDESNDRDKITTEIQNSSSETENNINDLKTKLLNYQITLCIEQFKAKTNFNEAKAKIKSAMGFNLNLYESTDTSDKVSVFFAFDLLSRTGKLYTLTQSNNQTNLTTINIKER